MNKKVVWIVIIALILVIVLAVIFIAIKPTGNSKQVLDASYKKMTNAQYFAEIDKAFESNDIAKADSLIKGLSARGIKAVDKSQIPGLTTASSSNTDASNGHKARVASWTGYCYCVSSGSCSFNSGYSCTSPGSCDCSEWWFPSFTG